MWFLSTRPPEMPALSTAMFCPARRRARKSGQRLSVPGVEAAPSVMESPKATTLRAPGAASTSTALRKRRLLTTLSALRLAALVASPAAICAGCKPSQ